MGFLEELKELFGTECLYEALDVERTDDSTKIKKAYYKQSLKCHPDRSKETDTQLSTRKFQVLGKIYEVLSDAEKRALYNETGVVDDDISLNTKDWDSYWRLLFPGITKDDIIQFSNQYKGSDKEQADVKKVYLDFKGDMDQILERVMCAGIEDEERFREIIQVAVSSGELPEFKKFVSESDKKKEKRKKKYAAEASEAEEMCKEQGMDENADLKLLLMKKQKDRAKEMNSFFDSLEEKYCQPKKKAGKKAPAAKSATKKGTPTKRKRGK